MSAETPTCPLTRAQVVDHYFLEHRAKLIDLAAFLDRVDRAPGTGDDDFRMAALRRCIGLLNDGRGDRARRILEALSDPTTEPIAAAPGKGAVGAFPGGAGAVDSPAR